MGHQLAWMQTLTGRIFEPRASIAEIAEVVCIEDIAGALSKQCRYGGHCKKFYSVAEHCVLMARSARPEHALEALMHDAAEAYLVDIPRAVKYMMRDYKPLEQKLEQAIAYKFGLSYDAALPWGWPPEVQVLDQQILANEQEQNMAPPPKDWELIHPPIPNLRLEFWTPHAAEQAFRDAFSHYNYTFFHYSYMKEKYDGKIA